MDDATVTITAYGLQCVLNMKRINADRAFEVAGIDPRRISQVLSDGTRLPGEVRAIEDALGLSAYEINRLGAHHIRLGMRLLEMELNPNEPIAGIIRGWIAVKWMRYNSSLLCDVLHISPG